MNRLPQLRTSLLQAAERQLAEAGSDRPLSAVSPRRRLPFRLLGGRVSLPILVVLILLTLAAVAFAATRLIETGAPVRSRQTFTPNAGVGVAIPRTEGLLGIAASDPAGGPPWTMRVYHTNRGLGCVQIGRLVEGRIGVLGQDGAFADDGRFHPLPAQASQAEGDCALLDDRGQTFLAMSSYAVSASGMEAACDPPSDKRPPPAGMERCPSTGARDIFYGLLGPDAKSITYTLDGHTYTTPTVGSQGAYLIVERAGERSIATGGASLPNILPSGTGEGQPIRSITYAGGQTCVMTRHGNRDGHGRGCQPAGYVAQHVRLPTVRELSSPIRVRQILSTRAGKPDNELRVSFTARVAVENARSGYGVSISAPNGGHCRGEGRSEGEPLDRNVRVGERLNFSFDTGRSHPGDLYPGCSGTYRGEVYYAVVSGGPTLAASDGWIPPGRSRFGGSRTAVVGRFSYRLPG